MKTSKKSTCLFPFYKIETCGNCGKMVLKNVFKLTVLAGIPSILLQNGNLSGEVKLGKEGKESTNNFYPKESHTALCLEFVLSIINLLDANCFAKYRLADQHCYYFIITSETHDKKCNLHEIMHSSLSPFHNR